MAKEFSEKAQAVLIHLQNNTAMDETHVDIAEAVGMEPRSVIGVLNSLQKKGLIERVSVDGIEKKVIRLTGAGASADPDAEKPEAE